MKVSSLFDLISDGRDLLTFFEGVSSREQLISRLERLKREGTDELLECVEGLQMAIASALGDTLEMSASFDDEPEPDVGLDAELDKIAAEEGEEEDEEENEGEESAAEPAEVEKPNPADPPAPEDPKNDVQPPG
jgi:hypothetical protein